MSSMYSRMYGGSIRHDGSPASKTPDKVDVNKSAVRSLSGMKVHGSHVKQLEVGDQIIDVPKIEYVQLLDTQMKEAREKIKRLEENLERSQSNYLKLAAAIRDLQAEMANTLKVR